MKKRPLYFCTAVLPLLALLSACKDDENEPGRITLSPEYSEVVFAAGGATSQTVKFSADAAWTLAVKDADWVEVAPDKGEAGDATVTVRLLETECDADRETSVTIAAGTATAGFRIIQKAAGTADDAITFPDGKPDIAFTPEGETTATVKFNATAKWNIGLGDADWVEVIPAEGEAGDATVTVRLLETECDADRTATATITAGTATAELLIVQKAPATAELIRIAAPQKRIVVGQVMPLAIETEPEGTGSVQVQWNSSDESVLTVSDEGVVTAVAPGSALVTARAGELSDECALEVTETFTTDGDGRSYTFADLAAMEYSGVKTEGSIYVVSADMVVSEEDTLVLGEGEQVKIHHEVEIKVLGTADFNPGTSASMQAYDESSVPAPLYFTGDRGGGRIANVKFVNCPVRYYGTDPLTVENCSFAGITGDRPAFNLGGSGMLTVADCDFRENSYPAISGGANMTTPLVFRNNYLYKNSADARNRPQINVTVAGNGKVEIVGNTVIGPGEITTNGGIAVANLLGIAGTNEVLIEGNRVSDCRYGITTNGVMDVRIIDNVLENNKWDTNPMNGGSGVSIYNSAGGQKVYMKGNTIAGHLWGITNIGSVGSGKGPQLNLGNLAQGDDYNPGGNVFRDNGNNGVLYDLYNNSPITVHAQGNTWNVAVQDEQSIEGVVFHKNDDPTLGEVIFMPAAR